MATKISFRVESPPVHRETPVYLHFSLPPLAPINRPLLVTAFGPVEKRKKKKMESLLPCLDAS